MAGLVLLLVSAAVGVVMGDVLFGCDHQRVFGSHPVGIVHDQSWYGRQTDTLLYPWACERCGKRGVARADEVLAVGSVQDEELYRELVRREAG